MPLWEAAIVDRNALATRTSVRRPPIGEEKFGPLSVVLRTISESGPLTPCG